MSLKRLVPLNVYAASSAPTASATGDLYFNTGDSKLYVWDGSNWIVSSGSGGTVTSTNTVAIGRLSADTASPAGTDTLIPFIDDSDPLNWWNPTTKRFLPNIAGYYLITISVWWPNQTSTGQYNTQVRKNGNSIALYQDTVPANNGLTQGGTKLVYLNGTTDYVDFTTYNGYTSAVNILAGTSYGSGTYFSAALMTTGTGPAGPTGPTGPAATLSSSTPLMNGTAAVGTSTDAARGDHVHPTDTSRAAAASPTFTGTITTPLTAGWVKSSSGGVLSVASAIAESDVTNLTTDLAAKAPLASPALTGTPTAPTATGGTNTTQIATTAFVTAAVAAATPGTGSITSAMILDGTIVDADISSTAAIAQSKISSLTSDLAAKAPLASPALTGTPTAPTATAGTNTTQIATTAYVRSEVAALVASAPSTLDTLNELAAALGNDANFSTTMTTALAAKAPLASPALTGTPTAPTATAGTNTTQVATTAFVSTAIAGFSALPSQTGNSGKYLTTDGSTASWGTVASGATVSATAPSSPASGALWFNSTDGQTYVYYGSAWVVANSNQYDIGGIPQWAVQDLEYNFAYVQAEIETKASLADATTAAQTAAAAAVTAQTTVVLDDIVFTGDDSTYTTTLAGSTYVIDNPYRVMISVNGAVLKPSAKSANYAFPSPLDSFSGYKITSDGKIKFASLYPAGSVFDARVMPTSSTYTAQAQNPFSASDILLGA